MKRCLKCGSWYYDDEIKETCFNCGSKEIANYDLEKDEDEIMGFLNDLNFIEDCLKVVETETTYRIECKLGEQNKMKVDNKFKRLAYLISCYQTFKNNTHCVIDSETNEQLYIGSKSQCENYAKEHETIWKELLVKEGK